MNFSIIMPTKDRQAILERTLENLYTAMIDLQGEVIVVNDSKKSKLHFPHFDSSSNFLFVANPSSGVASARNFGASKAKGDLLIFMDDDFLVTRESILRVLENAKVDDYKILLFEWRYPSELIRQLGFYQFGRYLLTKKFYSIEGWLGDQWRDIDVFPLKDGASYFLPIKKKIFDKIGGYDEKFPFAGAEDYDFVQRAKKVGVSFYLDRRHVIFHNEEDRVQLDNWLLRKRRDAVTHRIATRLGYKNYYYSPNPLRYTMSIALVLLRPVLRLCLRFIPNLRSVDFIYFKLVNILFVAYYFEGYHLNKK